MKIVTLIFIATFLFSCQKKASQQENASNRSTHLPATDPQDIPDSVALIFINAYIENLEGEAIELTEWVDNNPLVTKTFRDELHKLFDQETDLEGGGLDYDPILNAQDYPEEGFELKNMDAATGYVTVAGKKWKEFKLKLKLIKTDKGWFVDGAGVINIPEGQRATQ
jgi:hypothetical protein